MERVAAIDVGTNSVRLLVAEKDGSGLKILKSGLITTRLGQGSGSGVLQAGAVQRTVAAVFYFYQTARQFGPERVVVAATSAVRDAGNRNEFVDMVKERTGLPVRVLSGAEEAGLSYRGVLAGFPLEPQGTAVVDIGGGSTEIIWMQDGKLHLDSVNVGAVRVTEAGTGENEIAACLNATLEKVRRAPVNTLVGVGGTVTTLAAVDRGLLVYDPGKVHGHCLKAENAAAILARLERMSTGERKQVPGLQPERADIIVAGAVIAVVIMKKLGLKCMFVSEYDLLCGLVLEEVEGK